MDNTLLARAAQLLHNAANVAVLTGAGVSAESGIATFRDAQTGLWSKFDPEKLASQHGFRTDPGLVWRWYMARLHAVLEDAEPNPGHLALAQLAEMVPQFTLITQNVDNLHEQAGSQNVLHLHGSVTHFRCNACDAEHKLQPAERTAEMPPNCVNCNDLVRPDVVWFGEMLPADAIEVAWQAAEACDVMLVVGTSGLVTPAAHLPLLAQERGAAIIDVNPDYDAIAGYADLFLQGGAGLVLPQLIDAIAELSGNA